MNAVTAEHAQVLEAVKPASSQAPAIIPQFDLSQQTAGSDRLIASAIEKGLGVETIERLLDLRDRELKAMARIAFTDAMARFKQNAPVITKDKDVGYESKRKPDAGATQYSYATLGNVVRTIVAELAKYGLSHRWSTEQHDGGLISVTCVLTHAGGHSETVKMTANKDTTGSKNSIQALGSTVSYLERYTLLAVTGLAAEDQDDDGHGSEPKGVAAVAAETAESIAEDILKRLMGDLANCATDDQAAQLWASGSKSLHATGQIAFYDKFKKAVIQHRNKLKGGAK